MRVLVCGGRNYNDQERVFFELDELKPTLIIHGGASGADYLAAQYAKYRGVGVVEYRADWARHGRAAGPIRNQQMIDLGRPDVVVAFPGGRGTADMIERARKVVPVVEVR